MIVRMIIKNEGASAPWVEEFDTEKLKYKQLDRIPEGEEITPMKAAEAVIAFFNESAMPGEKRRIVLEAGEKGKTEF